MRRESRSENPGEAQAGAGREVERGGGEEVFVEGLRMRSKGCYAAHHHHHHHHRFELRYKMIRI